LEEQGQGQSWLEAITWVGQDPTWVVAPGSEWVSRFLRNVGTYLTKLHGVISQKTEVMVQLLESQISGVLCRVVGLLLLHFPVRLLHLIWPLIVDMEFKDRRVLRQFRYGDHRCKSCRGVWIYWIVLSCARLRSAGPFPENCYVCLLTTGPLRWHKLVYHATRNESFALILKEIKLIFLCLYIPFSGLILSK
jgi:hypothetical protein